MYLYSGAPPRTTGLLKPSEVSWPWYYQYGIEGGASGALPLSETFDDDGQKRPKMASGGRQERTWVRLGCDNS